MIIVVNCPGCKKRYELDGALAGKKSRCRQCGEVFRIPVPTARVIEPAASSPSQPPSAPPRASSWDAPPATAPTPQPSWSAAPLADLLGGDPVVGSTPRPATRPSSPASRSSWGGAPNGTNVPPMAARAKPVPSPAFEEDLPPPPRAGYRPTRHSRSSDGGDVDTDIGFTAVGLFSLATVFLFFGIFLYFGVVDPRVVFNNHIFAWGSGIMMVTAGSLWLWGVIWLLGLAFRQDLSEGLLVLLIPFYGIIFAARRWEERRGAFVLTLTPVVWVFLSMAFGFIIGFAHGASRGLEGPHTADGSRPSTGPGFSEPNPTPAITPRNVSRSARKADAQQVRLAEDVIRREIDFVNNTTQVLGTVHNAHSANQASRSLRFSGIFARGAFRGAGGIDLGPNEVVALKHRLGSEVVRAIEQLKAQCQRIRSIPGLQGLIKPDATARLDGLIRDWTLQPGEEAMPELVEPPPGSNSFAMPGPPGGFPRGPRGMPGPFPRGAFPPGGPAMPPGTDIVDQMKREEQTVRKEFGDRTVAILVTGLPTGGDPSAVDVARAISERIRELAPEIVRGGSWATIGDRFETVVAPVNDRKDLARRIDFGPATLKDSWIEVQLDSAWAASFPRQSPTNRPSTPSIAQARPDDPQVPAGADAITRSLIELKSGDDGKRNQALKRLQRTTPDGRVDQVVEAVAPLVEDDNEFLAKDAVDVLAVWKSPEAMAALIGRMKDNRHFVRSDSIKALGKYPEQRAAEAIVTMIKEDRFAAEAALKSMGEVAEPALVPLLRSGDSDVRGQACRILAQIGGQKTLIEMQSLPPDPDLGVRMAAQDAWKRIVARVGPPPKPARGKTTNR